MQQVGPDPAEITCPYTAHKKRCKDLRDKCPKWVKLTGKHPQSEVVIEEWACADSWEPILLVELSQRMNAQGDAIQLLRQEIVEGQRQAMKLLHPLQKVEALEDGRQD